MAATTLTTTTFANNQPRGGLNSVIAQHGSFNSGTTIMGTTGDTVFLCKIPHGAIILDFIEDHSSGATSATMQSGLATGGPGGQATYSAFIALGAAAAVNRQSVVGGLPYQVSASDSDPNRYGILAMSFVNGSTATTSLIINWRVFYKMPGVL